MWYIYISEFHVELLYKTKKLNYIFYLQFNISNLEQLYASVSIQPWNHISFSFF